MGSKGQNSFSDHGHVAYQFKENHECSNMVTNIAHRPPYLGMGSVVQKSTFSEHGHVAYQIKEYHECSNMVVHILPNPHVKIPDKQIFGVQNLVYFLIYWVKHVFWVLK